MQLSPAQRHSARIAAERLLRQQQSLDSETSLHVQIAALEKDVAAAAAISNRAERMEFKRDVLLPRWMPTAQTWLESDSMHQNPVLPGVSSGCLIPASSIRRWTGRMWPSNGGQETPAAFGSAFPVFVADTVLAWAETEAAQGQDVEPYFSRTLGNVMQHWNVYEVIKAKYVKFAGLHLLRDENGEPRAAATEDRDVLLRAKDLLEQAKGFDPKCGVGTMLQRIAARLRALEK